MENNLNIESVVSKLIGSISPTGQHSVDLERLENLKEMCELVNTLVTRIDEIGYQNKDSQEASVKEIADYANNFLTETLGIKD